VIIAPNSEYLCWRRISIPRDFVDQRIFLRFDGVYSYARVWINSVYVRDHCGGFTSWDCEITEYVKAGEEANLVVGVTDRSEDISRASFCAKHLIGGILRDVRLFAVPATHLRFLAVTATLGENYRHGRLQLNARLSSGTPVAGRLKLKLTDESGQALAFQPDSIPIGVGEDSTSADILVPTPRQWHAEHPNLYSFEVSLVVGDAILETLTRRIGFRTVERSGNRLLHSLNKGICLAGHPFAFGMIES
jgi:beta-galactosidase/beta-glucuronidase